MHLEQKEKHALDLKEERKIGLLLALSKRQDAVTRRAREQFRRPAFQGTALEPLRQQQDARH